MSFSYLSSWDYWLLPHVHGFLTTDCHEEGKAKTMLASLITSNSGSTSTLTTRRFRLIPTSSYHSACQDLPLTCYHTSGILWESWLQLKILSRPFSNNSLKIWNKDISMWGSIFMYKKIWKFWLQLIEILWFHSHFYQKVLTLAKLKGDYNYLFHHGWELTACWHRGQHSGLFIRAQSIVLLPPHLAYIYPVFLFIIKTLIEYEVRWSAIHYLHHSF